MKITQIPTPLLGGPSNGGSVSLKPVLGTGPKGDPGAKGDKGDTGDVTPAVTTAKTDAEAARDAAVTAKTAAETARDQAVAVGNTNDTIISGRINDPASATRSALNDSFARRAGALELMPMRIFGDSYTQGGNGADNGTRYWDRIASRLRTLTPSNYGVSGTRMDQILTSQIVTSWTPGSRGLVGFGDVVLNNIIQFRSTSAPFLGSTVEAFRSGLAYLHALAFNDYASSAMAFGPGWTAGVSDGTAGRYVDIAWNGDSAYVVLSFGSTGGVATIKDAAGTTLATVDTSAWASGSYTTAYGTITLSRFNGAVKLSGFGTGDHTVRLTTSAAAVTVVGVLPQNPNPPQVAWFKPGSVLDSRVSDANLAAYLSACAAVLADFPQVVAVDVDAGWNKSTMLAPDGLHPNDRGHSYIADRIEAALLSALTWRQGLNQINAVGNAYTPPAASYTGAGATAPSAPTGVAATAGNQLNVTWTRANDGGATITGQPIQVSSDSGTTWTLVGTAARNVTSYTITTGLTQGTSYIVRVGATNSVGTTYSTASSAATAGASPVTYAADTFTRADGSLGTAETGGTWTTVGAGTASIVSNQAQLTNDVIALLDDAHADGTWTVTLNGPSTNSHGLLIRATGNTDGLILWHDDTVYKLARRNGVSSYTQVITTAIAPKTGDKVKLIASGTSVQAFLDKNDGNGFVSLGSITDSTTTANTKAGLWKSAASVSVTFDGYAHTSPTS